MLHLEYTFFIVLKFQNFKKNRSHIASNFWSVVLEKDIKDQLKQSCEKTKKYYTGSREKGTSYKQ